MIKNIIFDLDETLVKSFEATDKLFDHITTTFKLPIEAAAFRKLFRRNLLDYTKSSGSTLLNYGIGTYDFFFYSKIEEYLAQDQYNFKEQILVKTFDELGIGYTPILIEKIAEEFFNIWFTFYEAYDDVEVLNELNKKYRLFVLTNGLIEMQMKKIHCTGIEKYFDDILISEEVKNAKPNPMIFEHLFIKNGLQKSETIMVGDSYETDILGAQKAGIEGILLSRAGNENKNHILTLTSLYGLLDILA